MRLPEMQTNLLLFDDVHRAEQGADVIRQLRQQRHIRIGGAALLHRDSDGSLHIDEFDDMTLIQGIVGGIVLGAVVAMFTSLEVIPAAMIAAFAGGLIGFFADRGINDDDLSLAGEAVPPRHSGLVLIALPEHTDLALNTCQGHIEQILLTTTPKLEDSSTTPGPAQPLATGEPPPPAR